MRISGQQFLARMVLHGSFRYGIRCAFATSAGIPAQTGFAALRFSLTIQDPKWHEGRALDSNPASPVYLNLIEAQSFCRRAGARSYAQAHISTQPPPPREDSRFPRAHEDQCRRRRAQPPPGRRPQTCFCQRRLSRLILSRRFLSRNARVAADSDRHSA